MLQDQWFFFFIEESFLWNYSLQIFFVSVVIERIALKVVTRSKGICWSIILICLVLFLVSKSRSWISDKIFWRSLWVCCKINNKYWFWSIKQFIAPARTCLLSACFNGICSIWEQPSICVDKHPSFPILQIGIGW